MTNLGSDSTRDSLAETKANRRPGPSHQRRRASDHPLQLTTAQHKSKIKLTQTTQKSQNHIKLMQIWGLK
jgi:hypothetical protein